MGKFVSNEHRELNDLNLYTGDFPCALYNCTGCHHSLVCGQEITGFPFELEEEVGKGGFASIYRGRFHQRNAAFKFVKIQDSQNYTYKSNEVGFYEYYHQGGYE